MCARTFGRRAAERLQLLVAGVRGGLHAVAQLAVDLADELEDLALEQRRVGLRPRLLPHALAREQLVGIGARRAARTGRSARRRCSSAKRSAPRDRLLAQPGAVVDQLHHRGDRRVEGEAPVQVGRDLVDRPVRLAQQLELGAVGSSPGAGGRRPAASATSAARRHSRPRKRCTPSTPIVGPVGVLVGGPDEQDVAARGVGAVALDDRGGETTLPLDLDIFAPSR